MPFHAGRVRRDRMDRVASGHPCRSYAVMPGLRPIAELLQPSLTEAHDLVGFDRPWNPRYVWLAMVMCGMVGGGALLAMNYRRLGMRRPAAPVFALFLGLQIGLLVLVGWLLAHGLIARGERDVARAFRFGCNLVAVALAWPFVRAQLARYRIYEMGDTPPAGLLGPGIVAFLLNTLLLFAITTLFAAGGPFARPDR
jgi:hypothetical protein